MNWISVEDKIPEIGEKILVVLRYHFGEEEDKKYNYWISVGEYYYDNQWLIPLNKTYDKILYWMPLPELPKEG